MIYTYQAGRKERKEVGGVSYASKKAEAKAWPGKILFLEAKSQWVDYDLWTCHFLFIIINKSADSRDELCSVGVFSYII